MNKINHETRAVRTQTFEGYTVEFHDSGFGVGNLLTGFTLWRNWDFRSPEAQLIRNEVELLTLDELKKAVTFAKPAFKQCSRQPREYLYKKMEGKRLKTHGHRRPWSEWVTN